MLEITCDESGYEGEKLIGSTTRLFAHASVCLPDAAGALAEIRARVRSPATQYKHWGPAVVAHDRQTQLPPRRIEVLRSRCALAGMRFLDAGSHPQIQIADMLAGTVRRITEDGDPALIGLTEPYL